MTDASQIPKLPWWVRWWTDTKTTRKSLRRDAGFDFLAAIGFLVCLSLIGFLWKFILAAVLAPAAFAVVGIWKLVAIAWMDRHSAWDHIPTRKVAPGGSTEAHVTSFAEPDSQANRPHE
jgi:hypothetical protein